MTIGSDSFSFVTPYGTCSIEEMYEFVDKIGFTPVETITCATLNGAKDNTEQDGLNHMLG